MKTKLLLTALGTAVIMTACSNDSPNPTPEPEPIITPAGEETDLVASEARISLSEREKVVRNAYNDFAFRLYSAELSQRAATDNLCLSPFGVYQVLSMSVNGDNGATADELLAVLAPEGTSFSTDELNSFNATMTHGLIDTDSNALVKVANSVWLDSSLTPTEEFGNALTQWYKADFGSAQLNSQSFMEAVNAWCADKTNGMIDRYLDNPLATGTNMFMVNALWFKGSWTDQFDPDYTVISPFNNIDGTTGTVRMMHMTASQPYLATDDAVITSKRFGSERFEMVFVVPTQGRSIAETADRLPQIVDDFVTDAKIYDVKFSMPGFAHNLKLQLDETLRAMGLDKMYTIGFNSMVKQHNLLATRVLQQVKIEVDENGATAAAVTSMQFDGMAEPFPSTTLEINRPFIYLIRERNSGAVLFIGQVTKF